MVSNKVRDTGTCRQLMFKRFYREIAEECKIKTKNPHLGYYGKFVEKNLL